MSRKKTFVKDSMGAHARLYDEIAKSPAWAALSYSARALYVQIRCKLNGSNNGDIEATLNTLKKAGFNSSSTVSAGLRELEVVGLIEKTRQGGIAAGGKCCSLYRFTDKDSSEFPMKGVRALKATYDWRKLKSVQAAEAAIRAAHAAVKRRASSPATENEGKLSKLKLVNSKAEPEASHMDSESEHGGGASVQKPKLAVAGGR